MAGVLPILQGESARTFSQGGRRGRLRCSDHRLYDLVVQTRSLDRVDQGLIRWIQPGISIDNDKLVTLIVAA